MNHQPTSQAKEPRLEKLVFPKGATIFAQGEHGDAAYILQSGRVSIHQHIDGQLVELDMLNPGEIFGEMAVLDKSIRMASAVAVEDCVVTIVPQALFEARLATTDKFIRGLIAMFMKNIRGAHRIFVRKPRSFRDHVKQMRGFSHNMKRFGERIHDRAVAAELDQAVGRLDAVLDELGNIAGRTGDKRHDLILQDDEVGVGLRALVGSEVRKPR